MFEKCEPTLLHVEWDFPAAGHVAGVSTTYVRDHGIAKQFSSIWVAWTIGDVKAVLQSADQASCEGQTVVGWVSYEAAPAFDNALHVHPSGDSELPLALFVAVQAGASTEVDNVHATELTEPWADSVASSMHLKTLQSIRNDIEAGRFYQLNYTTRMVAKLKADRHGQAKVMFDELKRLQPNGYCLLIESDQWAVISVSPELFFDWDRHRLITAPMKGTARPGQGIGGRLIPLKDSVKYRAENVMIVDLLRNDMSRVATPGTLHVSSLFDVQTLPTVVQMTSSIECKTKAGTELTDVFSALFPCGSITGAPKIETMQAVTEYEKQPRGVYCGAIGLLRAGGHSTFNVAIRTVQWNKPSASLTYGVGSGVTWDSDPQAELDEWASKIHLLHRAHANFYLFETLRLDHGHFKRLPLHVQRLKAASSYFGFPFNEQIVYEQLSRCVQQHPNGVFRVRLCLNREGAFTFEVFKYEDVVEPVTLQLADRAMSAPSEYLRFKTSWRAHYDCFAPKHETTFDTVLWVQNEDCQRITECIRGNIVVQVNGQRLTPAAQGDCLPGILREELLASGEISEALITIQTFAHAEQVWFVNSLRGWVPVDRVLGAGDQIVFKQGQ